MIRMSAPPVAARLLGAALLITATTGGAAAQEPLGRPAARDTLGMEAALEMMQTQLEMLLPAMQRLIVTLHGSLPQLDETAAEGPDVSALARRAARITRAYFDALVAEGFSREEALHIVSGMGPPGR